MLVASVSRVAGVSIKWYAANVDGAAERVTTLCERPIARYARGAREPDRLRHPQVDHRVEALDEAPGWPFTRAVLPDIPGRLAWSSVTEERSCSKTPNVVAFNAAFAVVDIEVVDAELGVWLTGRQVRFG